MGYEQALEAAGATVLASKYFGSYQGDWYAKVEYQGEILLISGAFGSCSYCDAFQGEFEGCYQREDIGYQERLALFGQSYLDDPRNPEEELSHAKETCEWDMEAGEMVEWLEEHFPTHGTFILEL